LRDRGRWEDNIKIIIEGMELVYVDRIHLAADRDQWHALVDMAINLLVLAYSETVSFSIYLLKFVAISKTNFDATKGNFYLERTIIELCCQVL
jgi:hypothetical protein